MDVVENPCKAIAGRGDAVVINVDYRLAPENPYPAGLHDCMDAVGWVWENAETLGIRQDKIGVAGDSAGGRSGIFLCVSGQGRGREPDRISGFTLPHRDAKCGSGGKWLHMEHGCL